MSTLRLGFMLALMVLSLAGCARVEDGDTNGTTDTTTTATPVKSKQDVTVCITALAPDLAKARVKANGSQRVCWKGHDASYVVRFTTATWPFEESADSVDGDWQIIKVEQLKASALFTLKERILPGGTESVHKYEVQKWPASAVMTPPTGPEIIGEG